MKKITINGLTFYNYYRNYRTEKKLFALLVIMFLIVSAL